MSETREYNIRIRGHGHDLPVATIHATDDRLAIKRCLKYCKEFANPGYEIYCVETGTAFPILPGGHTHV